MRRRKNDDPPDYFWRAGHDDPRLCRGRPLADAGTARGARMMDFANLRTIASTPRRGFATFFIICAIAFGAKAIDAWGQAFPSGSPGGMSGQIGGQLIPCAAGGVHLCAQSDSVTASGCGTSPSVTGNDSAGNILTGAGVGTACRLTFSVPYAVPPFCVVTGDSTTISYDRSTTALTLTSAVAAVRYNWHCFGKAGG